MNKETGEHLREELGGLKEFYVERLNKLKARERQCIIIEKWYKSMVKEHEYLVEEIAYLRDELEEAQETIVHYQDHVQWWERNSIEIEED